MSDKQLWGVCFADEDGALHIQETNYNDKKVALVFDDYDRALHEALQWSHENQAEYSVQPVYPRSEQEKEDLLCER